MAMVPLHWDRYCPDFCAIEEEVVVAAFGARHGRTAEVRNLFSLR